MTRKITVLLVAMATMMQLGALATTGAPDNVEDTILAAKTASTVLVDEHAQAFDAYTVRNNNYFKLRDIAQVLTGTEKQFEVVWDGTQGAIRITTGQPYTPVGGELEPAKWQEPTRPASAATARIFCDDVEITLAAYTIGGNNYVKLRELGRVLDFGVWFEGERNLVYIFSTSGYGYNHAFDQKILELVNAERTKAGVAPLTWNADLADVSRVHSRDMAEKNYFDHTNLNGESPFQRMHAYGIVPAVAAENIAAGATTPEEAVQMWMSSPGHKKNLLDSSFTEMGAGFYELAGSEYGAYWTQLFLG